MIKLTMFTCVLAATFTATAQQSNIHFSCKDTTTAPPEKIWQIWTDVPNWAQWDTGLKSARLEGSFTEGAKGKLTPDKGPAARFVIADLQPGKTYTFKTRIPLGWLNVKRELAVDNGLTFFTHEVWFTGPLKKVFGKKLGTRYRILLPEVLKNIKTIAERQI